MDRRGNRDEKPTYEELASALRQIVHIRKNYKGEDKELLKLAIGKAKVVVDELDRVEAKQFKQVVFVGCRADSYTLYRNDGSNGEQA